MAYLTITFLITGFNNLTIHLYHRFPRPAGKIHMADSITRQSDLQRKTLPFVVEALFDISPDSWVGQRCMFNRSRLWFDLYFAETRR